jgi:hypothetical protein
MPTPEELAELAKQNAVRPPTENKPTVTPDADVPPTWEAIFEHPRFKELTKRAKAAEQKLTDVENAQRLAEEAKLKEQARFQELYEAEKQRATDLAAQLTATAQAAKRTANLHALQAAAQRHQPPWAAEAVKNLARFVEADVLDAELDDKAADAQIKQIVTAQPYVLMPQRADHGSPPLRKAVGPAQPVKSGRPLTL